MASDDQPRQGERIPALEAGSTSAPPPLAWPGRRVGRVFETHRRPWTVLGLGLAAVALLLTAILFLRPSPPDGNAQTKPPSPLFRNWGKPEVALVLSGQMHGYLQPCGCSRPQYGGLARRYNFMQTLKDKGWPIVALDLGDIAGRGGPQVFLKYETAMKALDLMNYTAMGLGKNEFDLPLVEALGHTLNNPNPRLLAANLRDDLVGSWMVAGKGTAAVGVFGLIGPSVVKEVNKYPNVKFAEDNKEVLNRTLRELHAKKPELVILVYQGTEKEARLCADYCGKLHQADAKYSPVNLVLCLEEEEEPSGEPRRVGNTLILGMGHKGRYVGVVGAFRQAKGPLLLKYQLVSIGEEYDTPEEKEKANPVIAVMEEYAQRVKSGGYVSKFPRNKHSVQMHFDNAKFVGSDRCGDCHDHAFKIWKVSPHAHAFKTLVGAKQPSLRQFDGECVSCHVVGFNHPSGYADPANTDKKNLNLVNVGCESCHGPGSAHVNNPQNLQIRALMNPYKAKAGETEAAKLQRLNQLDSFCQKCHDIDNDVNWGKVPFNVKWIDGKIIHMNPPKAKAANAAK